MKKGQNWSIEAMIAITIFTSVVVVSLVLVNYLPAGNSKAISETSEDVMVKVESDIGLLDDYEIQEDKLSSLESMSADDLGELVGAKGDVCISFQTLEGDLITLNPLTGAKGIGIGNDTICGN